MQKIERTQERASRSISTTIMTQTMFLYWQCQTATITTIKVEGGSSCTATFKILNSPEYMKEIFKLKGQSYSFRRFYGLNPI